MEEVAERSTSALFEAASNKGAPGRMGRRPSFAVQMRASSPFMT